MNNTIKFSVNEKNSGKRIDVFLAENINHLTRSFLKKLIENEQVKLNKKVHRAPSTKVKFKDQIIINIIQNNEQNIRPKKIKLNIVYEDNDILIINKPKGMVVHPGAGNYKNTLVNALLFKYKKKLSNVNGPSRPGIVHRIDKETSGLLVIAKNNLVHSNLGEQFSNHSIERKYLCLSWGVIRPLKGKISTLISRDKKNRQLMTVSEVNGKKAITNYKTIKVFNIKDIPKISLLECELETGRTHQIRVHMNYLGNSIVGDDKYKKKFKKIKNIDSKLEKKLVNLNRQFLHAQTIGFIHPKKNKEMIFNSILPHELEIILKMLRKTGK